MFVYLYGRREKMNQNKLIRSLSISSDQDLRALADDLNIHLDGIVDFRTIKRALPKTGSYLILLRDSPETGHWTAVHNGYYFDSMVCEPPEILDINTYNKIQYQGTYNEFCGVSGAYCGFTLNRTIVRIFLMVLQIDLDTDITFA
jgi:hypothetical protein